MSEQTQSIAHAYAPPRARVSDAATETDAERIRREHIGAENRIKFLGGLHFLSGLIVWAAIVGMAITFPPPELDVLVLTLVFAVYGTTLLASGLGLRRLRPGVRPLASAVAVLGLLNFPIGSAINGVLLGEMYSARGRYILSEHYEEVVRRTPHVKQHVPTWLWVVLTVAIVGSAAVLASALL